MICQRREKLYYYNLSQLGKLRTEAKNIYADGGNRRDTKEIRRKIRKMEKVYKYSYPNKHYTTYIKLDIPVEFIGDIFYSMFPRFKKPEHWANKYYYNEPWIGHFLELTDEEFEKFLVIIKNILEKYSALI